MRSFCHAPRSCHLSTFSAPAQSGQHSLRQVAVVGLSISESHLDIIRETGDAKDTLGGIFRFPSFVKGLNLPGERHHT